MQRSRKKLSISARVSSDGSRRRALASPWSAMDVASSLSSAHRATHVSTLTCEHVVRATDRGDPRRRRARRGGRPARARRLRRRGRARRRPRRAGPALGGGGRAADPPRRPRRRAQRARAARRSCARSPTLGVPVQASGGIRSLDDARALLDAGADRVVVGTAAWPDPTPWLDARRRARARARRARRRGARGGWTSGAGIRFDDALAHAQGAACS